ncbi:restriction endonuclease subunit S [Salinibacter ruber]|jgi:type I restriction enzyme S subunit|uniref:restriction endonuclease subunit S n=1 Tax=Salinibacter ruber TaxID=146919 RepID=UPI00216732F6|nr:restriction endonuclease subunit S [Salinibacter ruber]MCS4038729.1 type I restriction enzyme S subunit [Salinibacter ruber]
MSSSDRIDISTSAAPTHSRYDDYEESGVQWLGEIPAHWETIRLNWAADYINGYMFSPDDRGNEGLPIVRIAQLTGEDEEFDRYDGDLEEKYKITKGDLLFSWSATLDAFVWSQGPAWLNQHIFRVEPIPKVDRRYLGYCLKSIIPVLVRDSHGSTMQHIKRQALKDHSIALPPLVEQRAIATFLDRETERIDTLIEKKERLIDLLEEKRTALISRVVTKGLDADVEMQDSGVEWLGEIPAGWDVARLKFLSEVQSGIAKGKRYDDNVETVELPYLRVANVQDGFLNLDEVSEIEVAVDEVRRYLLQSGDVLMTEGGDYDKLGRGTVWNGDIEPCLHQNHIFAVRPRSVESEWVALITQTRYAKHFFIVQSVHSTNLASISMSSLQDLPVVVPPRETRQAILDHVDRETERIDTLVRKVEAAIDRLKEYRTALISAAVTGQIDVRNDVRTAAK